jgi:hypothetical protein
VKLEADIAANENKIEAVEAELVELKTELEPLGEKEKAKTLDADDRARLAALRKEKEQLRKKEEQLRDKEKQLLDERAEKRSKIDPKRVHGKCRWKGWLLLTFESADLSIALLDAWTADLAEVPSIDQLRAIVNTPLMRALPYPKHYFFELPPEEDVATQSPDRMRADLEALWSTIFVTKRNGTSEESLHAVYDALFTNVLALLASHKLPGLRMDRYGVEESRTFNAQCRPDFLCFLLSQVLAFKGEEQARESDLRKAVAELSDKLAAWTPTFFGEFPYQLAFAAGSEMIQFFALDVKKRGARVPLCDAFSVTMPKARRQCVRIVVNLFRVLRALQVRYPEDCLALGDIIVHGSSTVTIMGDYVKKVARECSGENLLDLYETLRDRPLEGLARPTAEPPKFARGSLTVRLQPVGFFRNPAEDVKRAACSVLTALEGLHRIGWVHRDVRAPNVMEVRVTAGI